MAIYEVRDSKTRKTVVVNLFDKGEAITEAENKKKENPKANYEVIVVKTIHVTSDVTGADIEF